MLIGEDPYFRELLRYIHLNPLRAGMVADLDEFDHYRWTGHAAMMGRTDMSWHDCDFGLMAFGSDNTEARNAYRAFVADGLNSPEPHLDGGALIPMWNSLG